MSNFLELYRQNHTLIGWVPDVLIIMFVTVLIYFGQKVLIANFCRRNKVEHNIYFNSFVYAIRAPLSVVIWICGLILSAIVIREFFNQFDGFVWLESLLRVVVIVAIGWTLQRLISRIEYNLVNPVDNRKPLDKTTALAANRIATSILVLSIVLVVLQTLDIDVSGIITIGSAGTLIVGFAAKDMLANFFGGFMIFSDNPFKVGDWIRSPDKNIEGTVENIGWRVTRIRTLDKRPLYVQNGIFLNISIENASRMTNRRIKQSIGLCYSDVTKIPAITSAIEAMIKSHPEIDVKQISLVAFDNFGDSSLDCQISCFTKTTELVKYLAVQQDIFLKIASIVAEHGASMAFPTCTFEMSQKMLAQ